MSGYLVRQVEATPGLTVRLGTEVVDAVGGHRLEGLVLKDLARGTSETVPAAALFVMIGAQPATAWLPANIRRDEDGYVVTGRDLMVNGTAPTSWPLRRQPFLRESSLPGVFAVGDVRHNGTRRVTSAGGRRRDRHPDGA